MVITVSVKGRVLIVDCGLRRVRTLLIRWRWGGGGSSCGPQFGPKIRGKETQATAMQADLQRILILPKIWGDLVLDLYNLKSRNVTLLVPANAWSLPTLGDRAYFQSVALKLWNILLAEIRNIQSLRHFKRALKTSFFN